MTLNCYLSMKTLERSVKFYNMELERSVKFYNMELERSVKFYNMELERSVKFCNINNILYIILLILSLYL